MRHTTEQRLEKSKILAEEVLKTVERCKTEMTDKEKLYHLDQIAALASDVICDTNQYDEKEDVSGLGC